MEAIERFVDMKGQSASFGSGGWHAHLAHLAHLLEVSNPKFVVILGCFGLASNIVGLFLFHGMSFSFYCLSQEQCSPRYESRPCSLRVCQLWT